MFSDQEQNQHQQNLCVALNVKLQSNWNRDISVRFSKLNYLLVKEPIEKLDSIRSVAKTLFI